MMQFFVFLESILIKFQGWFSDIVKFLPIFSTRSLKVILNLEVLDFQSINQ